MTDDTPSRRGGCLCGRVRFRARGEPVRVTNCHCRMCQKATGAAYATWAEYPEDHVSFSGPPMETYRSSPHADRTFCPNCGAALTYEHDETGTIDIAVALFDEPDDLQPADEIWTASRRAWVSAEDLPQYAAERDGG